MKQSYKKIALLTFIIFAAIAIHFCGISAYATLDNLKAHREKLLASVQGHYAASLALYILIYILVAALSLPIAAPLTLIGGFLFGSLSATLATNIGATMGATLTFLLFRYLLGSTVQEKYQKQLATFNTDIDRYGAHYLLLARLIVIIPFFLVNLLAGLTQIPLRTFIWTTSVGILPGSFAFAYAGKQIGSISTLSDVFSVQVISAFALLIGLGLISILFKKYILTYKVKEIDS